ncbi:MAG: alpha-2-macroglobulin family protein [Bacteroidetes bacterium]|nr:MAG: alpha-2-macroglobulin family protein [Bacteroidota bacterium]
MKAKFLLLFLSIAILNACSRLPENEVVLHSRNFSDQILQEQNLRFTFNKELVDVSLVGDWDSTEYITFEPAVAGKFKWTAADELTFSPENGFAPSTDYTAKVNKAVLKLSDNDKLYLSELSTEKIEFHTPYLKAESLNAFWSRNDQNGSVEISGILRMNYPIDAASLSPLLKAKTDDKDIAVRITQSGTYQAINFSLDGSGIGEEDVMIKLNIAKGLGMSGSDYTTPEEQELAFVLPSRLRMEITDVQSNYFNNSGTITVYTSQELLEQDLTTCFSLKPAVTVEVKSLSNGFELKGNFDVNTVYALSINTKIQGSLGGKLKENYSKNISFKDVQPSLSFTNSKAMYLSSAGSGQVGLQIINVPKIKVRIYKIYENNILAYLRQNSYYDWEYYDYYEEGSNRAYREDYNGIYSDMVSEQTLETASLPKENGQQLLKIQLPDKRNEYRGIYFVKVSSADELYLNATKLVSVSDVGIMSKVMENKVMVFAHSILDATPMSNIDVSLISTNNQIMTQGKTGADGVLVFDKLDEVAEDFTPAMITVRQGDDFNFVPFSETRVETSRFDVGGKYSNSSGLDAYIYAPRNLYRPGEKIDLNTIIRTQTWDNAAEIPVKLKLVMPNGREFKTIRGKTSKQGAIACSFEPPASALTGTYRFVVYNGNDVELASYSISVEEFMPDRIRLKPALSKTEYKPGEKIVFNLKAENFFGPPAANRNYEVNFQMSRKYFHSKVFPNYDFNNYGRFDLESTLRQGTTDEKGELEEVFSIPAHVNFTGLLDVRVYSTVFDENGRPVHATTNGVVATQPVFYGINMEDYYVGTNKPYQIKLAAVNKSDKRVNAQAKVVVVNYEYHSVLEDVNGYHRWRSRKREREVYSKVMSFQNGETTVNFTPLYSGSYEIRVYPLNSDKYVSSHFYAYGWGNTNNTSFEVNTEGQIDITLDKEKYDVGDEVTALLKSPFSGKILVTLEREGVFEHHFIESDKRSAEFKFKVKEEHLPNIYLSATLIRPLKGSAIPLTVAHGIVPIKVEKQSSVLPVEIEMVAKSRSKTKQKIRVKTKPESDIEVTIAAVDEGILQLKNFKTPDAHAFFYQKRALQVSSYDIYAFLFPELGSQKSSGGDEAAAAGGEKRANPLANKRVKLLAKWSGVLHTNSDGIAEYELDIPGFSGEVRVMAMAYKNKSFGAASKPMTIADPLVISTSLPRFLAPGDELNLGINLANTTAKSSQAKVSLKLSGPLAVEGSSLELVPLSPNAEGRANMKVKALPQIGEAKVKVVVEALGETFSEELDITIRPASPLLFENHSGLIKGSEVVKLEELNGYLDNSKHVKVLVSKSPAVEFSDHLIRLVGYPHGCLEQTTSKAFPQIYLSDFIKKNKKYFNTYYDNREPEYYVNEAILKISSMQLYNGGFGYWPGASDYAGWSSIYATHFLYECKQAGYEVNGEVLQKALNFLKDYLRQNQVEDVYVYRNGTYVKEERINRGGIYALYVLALSGNPNRSSMNHYKAVKDKLGMDSRIMLAASYALIGDMKSYESMLPSMLDYQEKRQLYGSFGSSIRNIGISLNALLQVDPKSQKVAELMSLLSKEVKRSHYYNTQEMAFALLAVGKYNRIVSTTTDVNALIKINGQIKGRYDGSKDLVLEFDNPDFTELTIETGKGNVYYNVISSGISKTGQFQEKDNNLYARRWFYDRWGKAIDLANVKQNELIVVKLEVYTLYGSNVDNVAITDMLPAGFEIENPRLNSMPQISWIQNGYMPTYADFRDDRINIYTNLNRYHQTFYYMVRAVSKGTFNLGPVSADAMYDGEFHSYNGSGKVTIR